MAKLGIFASITTILATLLLVGVPATPEASAADACKRTTFKTAMVKDACKAGGQAKAKAVMKAWMKEKKIKTCNVCHGKLAPEYPLKADGLKRFTEAGGK